MTTLALQNNAVEELAVRNNTVNLAWPERYVSIISGMRIGVSGFKTMFKNPLLSLAKLGAGGYLLSRGITGHCAVYNMLGRHDTRPVEININSSITVNRSRQEVYEFWRKLDNLPLFMDHLKSVEVLNDERSRWTLRLPSNVADVSWEAEIIFDEPGSVIVWQSLPDAVISNAGKVRFIDTEIPNQTLVHVTIYYQPPAGIVGAGVAQLLNPVFENMVEKDINNFKSYMDLAEYTDEVAVAVIEVKED